MAQNPVQRTSKLTVHDENAAYARIQARREAKLKRELHFYRLNYFFNRSCCSFGRSVLTRFPSGAEVYIILLIAGLEQAAFDSSVQGIILPFLSAIKASTNTQEFFVRSIGLKLVANLLFPITGWIADVWIGRYHMIHLSAWLMWFGYSLAALINSFQGFDFHWSNYVLFVCYIAINVGSSAFQASVIPFGADQISYRTSHELSSYFYMYYWIRNLGSFMLFLTVKECSGWFSGTANSLTYAGVSVASITAILCILGGTRKRFLLNDEKRNPLKTVCKVLHACVTTRRPIYRSAFSYTGVEQPSRIDLTKIVHGGKFEEETVEDVKTFLQLVMIFLPLVIILVAYVGITAVVDLQLGSINSDFTTFLGCKFQRSLTWVFNVIPIVIIIPAINYCLLPFLREYSPTMILKIGIGAITLILSLCVLLALVIYGYEEYNNTTSPLVCMFSSNVSLTTDTDIPNPLPVPSLALILPYSIVALAEVFINVSSLEFFYAQSPHTMRSMMVGFFFFWWGISSLVVEAIIASFSPGDNVFLNCGIWYYTVLVIVACVGLAVYVKVATRYRNRQRGEIQSERFYRQDTRV